MNTHQPAVGGTGTGAINLGGCGGSRVKGVTLMQPLDLGSMGPLYHEFLHEYVCIPCVYTLHYIKWFIRLLSRDVSHALSIPALIHIILYCITPFYKPISRIKGTLSTSGRSLHSGAGTGDGPLSRTIEVSP